MDVPRTRTVCRLGTLALTALLVVGACGGEDDDPSDAAAPARQSTSAAETAPTEPVLDSEVPDLCALFTREDFTAVIGETAGTPERQAATGAIRGVCTTPAESGFPLVMIAAYNEVDREETIALVEAEPVDVLDVPAHWDNTMGLIIALEGRDWYLQVMATSGGADLETSTQVAEIVLDRL